LASDNEMRLNENKNIMTEVSESIAKSLVTRRKVQAIFGKSAKIERAFSKHPKTQALAETHSIGPVNLFTISSGPSGVRFFVNLNALVK